jgi:hypothetical protein
MKKRLFHCTLAISLGLALAALLLWLGAATTVRADPGIRCVNASGTGCDPVCGGCYASVQAAVNAAAIGDEIRIAGGTYTDPAGTVAVITKALRIIGGFAPDFSAHDPDMHQTVLDAQWGGSVISITNADDVLLMHLTLTRGDGTGSCGSNGCGGGIYSKDTSLHVGHCVIANNVGNTAGGGKGDGGGIYAYAIPGSVDVWDSQIVSNTANADPSSAYYSYGGGIFIQSGMVSLVQNQVLDNVGSSAGTGGWGGGIFVYGVTHADVLTNVIRGNKAAIGNRSGDGGGLVLVYSPAYVAGNHIEGNWTTPSHAGYGGGVYVQESDAHVTRNTIISNATGVGWVGLGGGVYVGSSKPVTLSNNLIAHNDADIYGGGVYVSWHTPPASQALLVNNTIADNGDSGVVGQSYAVLTMTNNLIAGHTAGFITASPFTGTITADTNLFWNTSDPITGSNGIREDPLLRANYHLGADSPAVDAGLTVPWLTTDLEGTSRPQGSGYDVGAFENRGWGVYLPLVLR